MSVIKNPIPEKYRAWIYLAGSAVAILLAPAVGFLEAAGKTEFILPVTALVSAIGLLVALLARVNLTSDTPADPTPVELALMDSLKAQEKALAANLETPTEPTEVELTLMDSLQAQERALVAALGAPDEDEEEEEEAPLTVAEVEAHRRELMRKAAELRDSKGKHTAE